MLAVVYARVSPGEHSKRGYSRAEQLELCRQKARTLAADSPLEILEFSDSDTSGDIPHDDRPGLASALAAARRHGADLFICLDPDRFSRDTYQALGAAQAVDATGARLEFVLHGRDTSPEGQLFFTLRLAIATFEKHKIKERTQRGIRGKLRRGELPYAPRPYGYRFNKETDTLEVSEEQAVWVRRMFRWVIDDLAGPTLIARRLNDLAVPTARGGARWHKQTVARMLQNPVYAGRLVVNKSDQTGLRRNRFLPAAARAKRRPKPASEWVTLAVPALVDAALWQRAQAVLARRRRRGAGAARTAYLLTGVAVCGLCGRSCHGAGGSDRRYYVCSGRQSRARGPGTERCPLPHLRKELLESRVLRTLRDWLADPAAYLAAQQAIAAADTPDLAAQQRHLEQAIAALEHEWDRRVEAYQQGWVRDRQKAATAIAAVRQRLASLQDQAAALAARAAALPTGADGTAPPHTVLDARIDAMGPLEWRQAIAMLLEKVIVDAEANPQLQPRR